MVAVPILEELSGSASGRMIGGLAGYTDTDTPPSLVEQADRGLARRLAVYPASAGFDLVDELDFLSARAIEPNVFFNPRFLAPAMPRLEDRDVRLAVIRDGNDYKSRLRLLVPFSIEKPAVAFGPATMRTWSSPFGPLGTPLLDSDDPAGVLADFLDMLARPHLNLPNVLTMPDIRLDGPFAALTRRLAEENGLPLETVNRFQRPYLESEESGDDYLRASLRPHHFREFRRQKRRLEEQGTLEYTVARRPDEIRFAIETFLALEASGWKGRARSAMAVDRFRAAFVREAAHRLAENDLCRVHALHLDGKAIASLVVFVENGVGYTWKTAFDEDYSAFSPGTLLMIETTRTHLGDPAIRLTDSCAVPDHPVMSRLWQERKPLGTLVLGLTRDGAGRTRQAALALERNRRARNMARILRNRVRKAFGRG